MIPSAADRATSPVPGIERRKLPRTTLCTTLGFLSDTNFYTGFTEDISAGGLFVATHSLQPLGTRVELEFALPSGHEIRAKGVVRWLRDPHDHSPDAPLGMGIEFEQIASEDLEVIRQFVALREPIFFET